MQIDQETKVDLLVVSAFPGDYLPTPASLIGALHTRGIDVDALSRDMGNDMRDTLGCWTSKELDTTQTPFERIMCFEPLLHGRPSEVVGHLVRALIPALGVKDRATVAMPLLATGDQDRSVTEMLPPLLYELSHWMTWGISISRLMIFVRDEDKTDEASKIFATVRAGLAPPAENQQPLHDIFISYSQKQSNEMRSFLQQLRDLVPSLRFFVDKENLTTGAAWEPALFASIERSKVLVPLFSPDYVRSSMCLNEYNFGWARWRQGIGKVFPIHLYSTDLLPHMTPIHHEDCRENDAELIGAAASTLAERLSESSD